METRKDGALPNWLLECLKAREEPPKDIKNTKKAKTRKKLSAQEKLKRLRERNAKRNATPEWRRRLQKSRRKGRQIEPAKLAMRALQTKLPKELSTEHILAENCRRHPTHHTRKELDTHAEHACAVSREQILEWIAVRFEHLDRTEKVFSGSGRQYPYNDLEFVSISELRESQIGPGGVFDIMLDELIDKGIVSVNYGMRMLLKDYVQMPLKERLEKRMLGTHPDIRRAVIDACAFTIRELRYLFAREHPSKDLITGVELVRRLRCIKTGELVTPKKDLIECYAI